MCQEEQNDSTEAYYEVGYVLGEALSKIIDIAGKYDVDRRFLLEGASCTFKALASGIAPK